MCRPAGSPRAAAVPAVPKLAAVPGATPGASATCELSAAVPQEQPPTQLVGAGQRVQSLALWKQVGGTRGQEHGGRSFGVS